LDDGIVDHHQLGMMLPDVDPQVALLLRPVGALRALKHRLFAPALDLLVPPHCGLPPVPFAAVPAREKTLVAVARPDLLVRQHLKFPHRMAVFAVLAHLFNGTPQEILQVWRYHYIIKFEKL
jgi:hypothetical protein